MVVRVVVGLIWSLVTGLGGTWLMISPWAMGQQNGTHWSIVTAGQFWTGLGLIVIAVTGLTLLVLQLLGTLRGGRGEAIQAVPLRVRSGASRLAGSEMDGALIALAQALVADLNSQRAMGPRAQNALASRPPNALPGPAAGAKQAPGKAPRAVPGDPDQPAEAREISS